MTKNNPPLNHHYVPEFYQKGFSNDEGKIFAYKKAFGSIKGRFASEILYEKNLHTIEYRGDRNFMIEQYYSQIETEFSKYIIQFKYVVNDTNLLSQLQNDESFVKILKIIIAIQFWRTPCQTDRVKKYCENLVGIYDAASIENKKLLGNDRKFVKFLQKRSDKVSIRKTIQFMLLPLITFDLSGEGEGFKYFLAGKDDQKFVTCDRPVLFDDETELFSYKKFCFPLSKELLVVAMDDIEAINIEKFNSIVFKRAREVVVSSSREQLEKLKYRESVGSG